jgi:hypothetical protein
MMKSLKVEGKSYMGVGKIKPLNLGNFSPLLTPPLNSKKQRPPNCFDA